MMEAIRNLRHLAYLNLGQQQDDGHAIIHMRRFEDDARAQHVFNTLRAEIRAAISPNAERSALPPPCPFLKV